MASTPLPMTPSTSVNSAMAKSESIKNMLTTTMKKLIQENTIGLVATITPDGYPAVSPKATMVILDDTHIAFFDLRSPKTRRNIEINPSVELNFIDVFRRQACRIKGIATYIKKDDKEFDSISQNFKTWVSLINRANGIFIVEVLKAQHIFSPAYDDGADEELLKTEWLAKYNTLIS
jgi:predicted pyridoxine 5'-phosphate oxidase superfamily flavin-nucleotide-binding protein